MRTYQNLLDFDAILRAMHKAERGKGKSEQVAKIKANELEAAMQIQSIMKRKAFQPSKFHTFYVYEPKKRLIKSSGFLDKVVQHLLCDEYVEPVWEKTMILDNYASQPGKGTLFGLDRLSKFLRKYFFSAKAKNEKMMREIGMPPIPVEKGGYADGYVLKCDIYHYFYQIPHRQLKEVVKKRTPDPDVLDLIYRIIDSDEDPGIPIGNQLSQWLAVLYLSDMDHFIKEKLQIKFYGRYMDDFYLISESKEELKEDKEILSKYLETMGLRFNQKTQIFPLRNGIDFLGFHTYLTESGKVIRKLRRTSKSKMKHRTRRFRHEIEEKKKTPKEAVQSYQSWRAHAAQGNCYHLIQNMDDYFFKEVKGAKYAAKNIKSFNWK